MLGIGCGDKRTVSRDRGESRERGLGNKDRGDKKGIELAGISEVVRV